MNSTSQAVGGSTNLSLAPAFGLGLGVAIGNGFARFSFAPSAVAVLARRTMASTELAKTITLFTVVFSIGQPIGPSMAGWLADATVLKNALVPGPVLLAAASCTAPIRLNYVSARIASAEAHGG